MFIKHPDWCTRIKGDGNQGYKEDSNQGNKDEVTKEIREIIRALQDNKGN